MGDRANVKIAGVHLYTHWKGSQLPHIVQKALNKRWRWSDESFLARIIFCEMIEGKEDEETGFGISKDMCDNSHLIIDLNCETETISFLKEGEVGTRDPIRPIYFGDYIKMTVEDLNAMLREIQY